MLQLLSQNKSFLYFKCSVSATFSLCIQTKLGQWCGLQNILFFWVLIVIVIITVTNITNKLQNYKYFSHTIAYGHAIFLTWKSISMESFYLNISFYFFPFQIKYSFFRLEYKRRPLPNLSGQLSSVFYSIHVPASSGFVFLITWHRVLKENGFLSFISSYLASNQSIIFILLCWSVTFCVPGCFKTWNNPTAQTSNCGNHQAKTWLMRNIIN